MRKSLFIFLLFSLLLFAREIRYPTQVCPAYNNLKHTKNSNDLRLRTDEKYTILEHHKGQYLLLIPEEEPVLRWVDEKCFLNSSIKEKLDEDISKYQYGKKYSSPDKKGESKKYDTNPLSHGKLLALTWHNAFCEKNRDRKECRRNMFTLYKSKHRESHFMLHGLWPQPANKAYCGVDKKYVTMDKYRHWNKLPEPELSQDTKKRLLKNMPGVHSYLHRHEWIKHGTCSGMNAEAYFSEAITFIDQFHDSDVSDFFENNIGKRVTLKQIRDRFDRSFGKGSGERVELRCQKGMIHELWIYLGNGTEDLGSALQKGKKVHSRCTKGILDKAGYGK